MHDLDIRAARPEPMSTPIFIKILAGIIVAVTLVSFGWWGSKVGLPSELPDSASLRQWFDELGVWGPVAVIGSMVVAILVSPVPSAPIALSAGAIYGHFWNALRSYRFRNWRHRRLQHCPFSGA